MRYNEENTNEKEEEEEEEAGRQQYLQWIESKPECKHVCFTHERWCKFDSIFLSTGTQVICDIKGRNYAASFFDKYSVEVDAQKARDVYKIAKELGALPVIITCTNDGKFIVSDLTLAKKTDVTIKQRQTNDNDHKLASCETINLSGCTIN